MTLVRLITFRSAIFARFKRTSRCTPPAKTAFCSSVLRFSNGRTAMLFWEMAVACAPGVLETDGAGWTRAFDFVKYHPAIANRQAAATPAVMAIFLNGQVARVFSVRVW